MIDVFFDAETAFDKQFSLRLMPTAAYVRDPRFQCYGAAIAIPGVHGPKWYDEPQMRDLLDALPWGKVRLTCHNSSFDGLILSEKYRKYPAQHHDTMHQARYAIAQGLLPPEQRTSLASLMPLVGMTKGDTEAAVAAGGEQLASYALDDITATMRLKDYMPALPEDEAAISDLHIRMAVEPRFHLDEELLRSITAEIPPPEGEWLGKNEFFAQALRARGIEPLTKSGKKKEIYAFAKTDDFIKELLIHPDPVVRTLVQLRLDNKSNIERTRAQTFLDIGSPLPAPLAYYKAVTGRSSGAADDDDTEGGQNMQNLPTRNGEARLRRALRAPEGYKIMSVDSSQVEVRVITWRSKDAKTQEVFDSGRDVYTAQAADMYNRPESECKKGTRYREIAKSARLGLQFAQKANGFRTYCARSNLYITQQEAEDAVVRFERATQPVVRLWAELERLVRRDKGLQLPSGRRIVYSGIQADGYKLSWVPQAIFQKRAVAMREHLWKGTFVNNWVQGTARDLVMQQTVRLANTVRSLGAHVILSVHDEAVLMVPDAAVEDVKQAALECFSWVPDWAEGLRVKGNVNYGQHYDLPK